MKAQFTFLSGARAGQTDVLSQPTINIGRHPQSELRFDSDRDLDVSSRHAVITTLGDMYVLRDLGSTNGTVVNGRRLTTDHVLASKDVLRFGLNGPQVEFTAIPGPVRSPAAAPPPANGTIVYGGAWVASEPTPPPPGPPATPPLRAAAPGTTTRVRVEVARQTRRLRSTAVALFVLLTVLSGAYLWQLRVTSQRLAAQRHFLLAQVDRLMGEIDLISTGSVGLRAALDSAQAAAEDLKHRLAAAPHDAATINALRHRYDAQRRRQCSEQRLRSARTGHLDDQPEEQGHAVPLRRARPPDQGHRTDRGRTRLCPRQGGQPHLDDQREGAHDHLRVRWGQPAHPPKFTPTLLWR